MTGECARMTLLDEVLRHGEAEPDTATMKPEVANMSTG